jgi:hypothetical protein
MKFGPDCSGACEDCCTHFTGGCLAGHGDDESIQITKQRALDIIAASKNKKPYYNLNELKSKFPELFKE